MNAAAAWKILVVDDDRLSRESLTDWLQSEGFAVVAIPDTSAAGPHLDDRLAVAVADLKMLRAGGLELLRRARERAPHAAVILLAGYGAAETAVVALKEGAFDYLTRPIKPADLCHKVRQALARRELLAEIDALRSQVHGRHRVEGLVGDSPALRAARETVRLVADTKSPVLVTGECGTGKELIARALHHNSGRRHQPFVPVSCAAVPDALLEGALFGQDGAERRRGLFQAAQGGTLFIDLMEEIGLGLQAKLLRAIETQRVLPVGGDREVEVDVRVVASAIRNLHEEVMAGSFREDLHSRLRVVEIRLPPLRERAEDIPLLSRFFLEQVAVENRRIIPEVAPEAIDRLLGYGWPGNVRELRNTLEPVVALSARERIELADLPAHIRSALPAPTMVRRGLTMAEIEKEAIRRTLEQTGGRRTDAAKILDLSVRTLQRKIKEYGLPF